MLPICVVTRGSRAVINRLNARMRINCTSTPNDVYGSLSDMFFELALSTYLLQTVNVFVFTMFNVSRCICYN